MRSDQNMSSSSISIPETIAAVGVILSLVFVGFEIRQNTNISAAEAVFNLNEAGRQTLFLQISDPAIANLVQTARESPESLTDEQRYRYRRWVFAFLNLYESAWNHHRRGVISDADLEGWKSDYCVQVSFDAFVREMEDIEQHSSEFRGAVQSWCD